MIELSPAKLRGDTTPLRWQLDRQMKAIVISCEAGHIGIVEQAIPPSGEPPEPVGCHSCDWEGQIKLIGYRP